MNVEAMLLLIHPECIKLRDLVNEALYAPGIEEEAEMDAVNWADLSCVDALFTVSVHGEIGWQVEIEEVSPSAPNLHKFIESYLRQRGYTNVNVITSW